MLHLFDIGMQHQLTGDDHCPRQRHQHRPSQRNGAGDGEDTSAAAQFAGERVLEMAIEIRLRLCVRGRN